MSFTKLHVIHILNEQLILIFIKDYQAKSPKIPA